MNYIIKAGTQIVIATYPSPHCFVRSHLTIRINIFTEDDIIFRDAVCLDLNVKSSCLMIPFISTGWIGFLKNYNILIITPDNLDGIVRTTKPTPKQSTQKPFLNMKKEKRTSFDEWLKSIEYKW